MVPYKSTCCVPDEFKRIVSQDVPRELYAQHFTRNPFTASLMLRVLLDTHCPNTFLLAVLFQMPSVISSVQLKRNGREVRQAGPSVRLEVRVCLVSFKRDFLVVSYQRQSVTI